MATLTQPTRYTTSSTGNWLAAYKQFADDAEFNRTGWAATALAIQGCLFSPTLLLIMAIYGGGDWQFLTSMLCFLLVLVTILAALPAKYIFPAFATSFVIHATMILLDLLA